MTMRSLLAAMALTVATALPALTDTYRHAQGEITLDGVPKTVVVFDMNAIDTLTALGVDLAGVPSLTYPAYLADRVPADIPRVGTLFEPDMEAVFATQPDLIIAGGRSAPKYADLSRIAPTIDLTLGREDYLASARANIETLGAIFDKQAEAEALLAEIDAEVAALKDAAPQAGRVLIMLTSGNRMSAHGAGSRFGIIHDDYGLTPAADGLDTGNHGQAISNEFILETNPDWLFVVDRDSAIGQEGASALQTLDNELVRQTRAWQQGHVLVLDPGIWYLAGGGATALKLGAAQIRTAISAE